MFKLLQTLAITRRGLIGVRRTRSWQPDLKVWHRLMGPLVSVARLTIGKVTKDLIVSLSHLCGYSGWFPLYALLEARASLKHLQRLDIKLLAYQASAIFNQVVGAYSLWERWRARAFKSGAAVGTSPRESQGPRPSAAPPLDTRLPSELEEDDDESDGGSDLF
jgi:hypothetical protein